MTGKSIKISCNVEALQMRGVTLDGVKHYMDFLSGVLKKRFLELVPTNIIDIQSLDRILTLYEVLSRLKDVSGFERHASEYNKSRFLSTLFVSRLALFLKDKVDEIELEPITTEEEGNPDIRIAIGGCNTYIECKNIESSQFSDIEEHRKIFKILEPYIEVPHQVSFSYKKTPNYAELNSLGESIRKLIPKVKTTGNIINNDNYVVNIQLRDAYGDPRIKVEMDMIIEDNNSGDRVPGHAFMEQGKTFAVNGPDVDYKKILQTKVKSARNQSVSNNIFITAINTDMMLGGMNENIRCIEALFQPDKNTRYSSVLFANNEALTNNGKYMHIINPYAETPVTDEITRLFMHNPKV